MSSPLTTHPAPPRLAWLPMTGAALRRLRAEARRLRARLHRPTPAATAEEPRPEAAGAGDAAAAALDLHRLHALDAALGAARVVDAGGMAVIGSRVTIREADGTQLVLTLVPPGLAIPREGRISPDSPLGEALLGRSAGERARVVAPAGAREITILDVA